MSEADICMIKEFGKNVERGAGKTIRNNIMQGSEQLTKSSSKETVALWMCEAIHRLDSAVDEKTRMQIMEACGRTCASINTRVIEAAKRRRKKFKDLAGFLEAEQQKPMKGTRLIKKGDILYHFYTPKKFTPPMRCYCSLFRGLPNNTTISSTYCHCSKAFVQRLWESVFGHPVKVDLLQSVVSGDPECKFAIHLSSKGH